MIWRSVQGVKPGRITAHEPRYFIAIRSRHPTPYLPPLQANATDRDHKPDKMNSVKASDRERCAHSCRRLRIRPRVGQRGVKIGQKYDNHRWMLAGLFHRSIRLSSLHPALRERSTVITPSPRFPVRSLRMCGAQTVLMNALIHPRSGAAKLCMVFR
jgi:hypothetical protein